MSSDNFDQAVWRVVSNIPPGCVMSYGEVARAAGFPRHARRVSQAMSRCKKALPWHRVLRSDGQIAFAADSEAYQLQKKLLLAEGLRFVNGKISSATNSSKDYLDQLLWSEDAID